MSKKEKKKPEYIINMIVRDDTEFLSEFSSREAAVISSEVADFLEKSLTVDNYNKQIILNVSGACINEMVQYVYNKAIKEYYRGKYKDVKKMISRQNAISAVLFSVGLIFLAITHILGLMRDIPYLEELIDIIACVFIWETVHSFAFRSQEMRVRKKEYLAFLNMHIRFNGCQ